MRKLGPLERLQKEFGGLLGEQTTGTIAVLAVTSAVGEELLFRGALQPLIGFWPTAILFGLLHGGGAPRLLAWTIFAFLSGILLGFLADHTGSLLAPILCHLTINFWNLQALAQTTSEAPP
jgi:membrane protease YdiL (CAAX protease family)